MRVPNSFLFYIIITFSCHNNSMEPIAGHELAERANEFYENGKYSEAMLLYDSLLSIDSTKGGYYFKRGYCRSMLSDNDNAIADYLKAIKYNYSQKGAAYLNIGVLHRSRGLFNCSTNDCRTKEYDSALYYYNECLKIDPTDAEAIQEKKAVIEELKQQHSGIRENAK